MTGDSPPTLFAASTNVASNDSLFLATNRYNLLEFLSGCLVMPAPAIAKYYDDISGRANGHVPLFSAPIPDEVVRAATDPSNPGSFPVLIEFDRRRIADLISVPTGRKGKAAAASAPLSTNRVVVIDGPIPLSAALAVHFRTQREKDEHSARRYNNVFDSVIPLSVSPDLFTADSDPAIIHQLAALPASTFDAPRVATLDRFSGALALLARVLPARAEILEQYVGLLGVATTKASKEKKRGAALGGTAQGIPQVLRRVLDGDGAKKGDSLDDALFLCATSVLSSINPKERWRPLEVLENIERLTKDGIGDEATAELRRTLDGIGAIVRGDREFRPFSPSKGLASAKAILMVLLREDPDSLVSWEASESGADAKTRMLAVFLCGVLVGHKQLSTTLRSPLLDRVLANRASAALYGRSISPPCDTKVVAGTGNNGHPMVSITVDGEVALSFRKAPPSVEETLSQYSFEQEGELKIGLAVVDALGWEDCVRTVVTVPSADIRLTRGKKGIVADCAGTVLVERHIDSQRFVAHLADGISPDRIDRVRAILTESRTR